MHGLQSEPTKTNDNNLLRILELKKLFPDYKLDLWIIH